MNFKLNSFYGMYSQIHPMMCSLFIVHDLVILILPLPSIAKLKLWKWKYIFICDSFNETYIIDVDYWRKDVAWMQTNFRRKVHCHDRQGWLL